MRPIGIFDSGVGGLTVMRQIHELLPCEDICYFGDTARVPYGNKSPETIRRYVIECANFLLKQHIKILVIACNSASSVFDAEELSQQIGIPTIGVITPGIQQAVCQSKTGRIAVIGTRATIAAGLYEKGIREALPHAVVFSAACPLLVPLIEEQLFDHQVTRLIIEEYTAPLQKQQPDTFVLGCTHYPLLTSLFADVLGPHVSLVDPAVSCSLAVKQRLVDMGQLNSRPQKGDCAFFVSDDSAKFKATGEYFFHKTLGQVVQV